MSTMVNEFVKPQEKVQSYLTDDWEGLVKSCESPFGYIAPDWANESFEAFDKWMLMPREESEKDKVII